jgi:hypothetical protein
MTEFPDTWPAYLTKALRERTTEEGDCLMWTGVYANETPIVYIPLAEHGGKKRKYITVRKAMLQAQKRLKRGQYGGVSCGNPQCVAPDHVKPMTASQLGYRNAERGMMRDPMRNAKIARAKQQHSTLTWDDIDAIRASEGPQQRLAERYGVSKSLISLIKRRLRWANRPGAADWASVFWRLAA